MAETRDAVGLGGRARNGLPPVIPDLVPGPDGHDILPPGRHQATLGQIEATFVLGRADEALRRQLWRDFTDFAAAQAAHGLVALCYWIDGSFISSKVGPRDVDFTAVIDQTSSSPSTIAASLLNVGSAWKDQAHPVLGRPLALDAFAIVKRPDDDPAVAEYLTLRGYWDDWWQRCRASGDTLTKGYLEVRP